MHFISSWTPTKDFQDSRSLQPSRENIHLLETWFFNFFTFFSLYLLAFVCPPFRTWLRGKWWKSKPIPLGCMWFIPVVTLVEQFRLGILVTLWPFHSVFVYSSTCVWLLHQRTGSRIKLKLQLAESSSLLHCRYSLGVGSFNWVPYENTFSNVVDPDSGFVESGTGSRSLKYVQLEKFLYIFFLSKISI